MLKKIFVLIAAVLITGITQSCRISYKFNGAALDYNIYHTVHILSLIHISEPTRPY